MQSLTRLDERFLAVLAAALLASGCAIGSDDSFNDDVQHSVDATPDRSEPIRVIRVSDAAADALTVDVAHDTAASMPAHDTGVRDDATATIDVTERCASGSSCSAVDGGSGDSGPDTPPDAPMCFGVGPSCTTGASAMCPFGFSCWGVRGAPPGRGLCLVDSFFYRSCGSGCDPGDRCFANGYCLPSYAAPCVCSVTATACYPA